MTEARLQRERERERQSLKGNHLKSRSLASQACGEKWVLLLHKAGGCN